MDEKTIFTKFVGIIKLFVKAEPEQLEKATMETRIIQDLKINSARLVDIIIKAEDTFDIEIDDDDADSILTIGNAVEIIKQKIMATA